MGGAIEDTMFFPRLRRHAKWMFVFLALVFALGFVGFGVGAGGIGIGDIFRDQNSSSGISVSDAREQTERTPRDPDAWRELSTALQTEGETQEAVSALKEAVSLAPKDLTLLRELSALYVSLGVEKSQEAQQLQIAASLLGGSGIPGALTSNGVAVVTDKVGEAIQGSSSEEVNAAALAANNAYKEAVTTYQSIAKLQPTDPNVQLELAQTAQQAADTATAIAAYERFLELAPDDPTASIVKQQLKTLKGQGAAQG
ncbi:MAG TPA: tetratricopeptide repeat protein [Gaiellaceae bacterium]|jgi:tetratricopeptide (TPR) repeat protein|nr:tetratricopeptide repeat protein [Gaiellaceae bacterium]